jgi:hypothetical protein
VPRGQSALAAAQRWTITAAREGQVALGDKVRCCGWPGQLRRLPLRPARKRGEALRANDSTAVGFTATGATAAATSGDVDSQRASASNWSIQGAQLPCVRQGRSLPADGIDSSGGGGARLRRQRRPRCGRRQARPRGARNGCGRSGRQPGCSQPTCQCHRHRRSPRTGAPVYSAPSFCCSSVKAAPKSYLKLLPSDETHGKRHPICRL